MKLEQQVTSLELSKRLKELGVKQDSIFYWRLSYSTSESFDKGVSLGKKGEFGDYRIQLYPYPRLTTADVKWNENDLAYLDETEVSAFTVAELGEMLPSDFRGIESFNGEMTEYDTEGNAFKSYKIGNYWFCEPWEEDSDIDFESKEKTEANARAKMLIYLLENKLISLN